MRWRGTRRGRVLQETGGLRAVRDARDCLDEVLIALGVDDLAAWDAAWHEIERIARAQPSRRPPR